MTTAVVKAGAYGLNLNEVYNAISDDVESFAVITLKEAKALRQITDKPILLFQGVHETKDYSDVEDLSLNLRHQNNLWFHELLEIVGWVYLLFALMLSLP